jgi:glycerol-3-phosphate dehydrogenase
MNDPRENRVRNLVDGDPLDALIVGGGITGAPIYQALCLGGYRVALVDKGDFASGSSQASGMLIWGGLLYLRNLEFSTVIKLCRARKNLLKRFSKDIAPLDLHYLTGSRTHTGTIGVWLALQLYWALGGCELRRPRFLRSRHENAHVYQEGMLLASDSRFVIERIIGQHSDHGVPLNHCRLVGADFDSSDGLWRVDLKDEISGAGFHVRSKTLVNAAGVWADELNRIAGLESPYKHVFSKGVYLTFPRNGEYQARVHPMYGRDDVLTHVPWGPVMMWGPTETGIRELEPGLSPDREDIRFLLDQARHCLRGRHAAEDVVSVRCGIRPLAVPKNFSRNVYPLSLSRRHQVVVHKDKPALSLYGGKLTSSIGVAEHAAGLLKRWISSKYPAPAMHGEVPAVLKHEGFGHSFVTPEWARDREFCVTLDDYLRRRTNIAQWTPRMGLGNDGGRREKLLGIARVFTNTSEEAVEMVNAYERRVRILHDPLFLA